ncbi:hypothetical protein ACJJTC_006884 [Scirpophaga incertulas]
MNLVDKPSTVLLQTVKLNLSEGMNSVTVRALLDSGAQRSFVKSDVIKKLKSIPSGQEHLSHNLFGGIVKKMEVHNSYVLNCISLDGTFKFQLYALEQKVICEDLPKVRSEELLLQLKRKGSLYTGRSEHVSDNLLAIQTKFGWVMQGPTCDIYKNNYDSLYAYGELRPDLNPHKPHTSEVQISPDLYAPTISPINHIINISIPTFKLSNKSHEELKEAAAAIETNIQETKNNALLPTVITYHDIHQYVMNYIVLGIIVVIGIFILVWRILHKRRCTPRQQSGDAQEASQVAIELVTRASAAAASAVAEHKGRYKVECALLIPI